MRRPYRIIELRAPQRCVVKGGVALAAGGPVIQPLELHAQHHRLQLIEPEVPADERVVVLGFPAMHPQDRHALRERRVVRDAHAGIAEGAQVLGGEEGQAADLTEAAGALVLRVLGSYGLRRILDDLQSVAPRALHERRHVGHLPVQVHRHEGTHSCAAAAMQQLALAPLAVLLEEGLERRG